MNFFILYSANLPAEQSLIQACINAWPLVAMATDYNLEEAKTEIALLNSAIFFSSSTIAELE